MLYIKDQNLSIDYNDSLLVCQYPDGLAGYHELFVRRYYKDFDFGLRGRDILAAVNFAEIGFFIK